MNSIAICYLEKDGDENNKCLLYENELKLIQDGREHQYPLDTKIDYEFAHKKWMFPFITGWILLCLSLLFIFRALLNPWLVLGVLIISIFSIYIGWEGSEVLTIRIGGQHHSIPVKSASPNLRAFLTFITAYISKREGSPPLVVYHLTNEMEWSAQEERDYYSHSTLEREGYIHCSTKESLEETYEKYFKDEDYPVLITIDPLLLDSQMKLEYVEKRKMLFPHIYGAIRKEAIVSVQRFKGSQGLVSLMA